MENDLTMNLDLISEEITYRINNKKLIHDDVVIIGDNGVGKSRLINKLKNNLTNTALIDLAKDINTLKSKDIAKITNNKDIILLDNIDIAFNYIEKNNILKNLKDLFRNKKIVLITHSADVLNNLKQFTVIQLYNNYFNMIDSNDIRTFQDAYEIMTAQTNIITTTLRKLLNSKLSGNWCRYDDYMLRILDDLYNKSYFSTQDKSLYKSLYDLSLS